MSKGSGRTIMVVEDYDDTRLMLRQALEIKGYHVLEAINGQEAVDIANREHPDLILMDLDLPILDGIAATQRIRQQAQMDSVPIVAVTAYPMSYTRVKAFAKGCNEYMAKPIDLAEVGRACYSIFTWELTEGRVRQSVGRIVKSRGVFLSASTALKARLGANSGERAKPREPSWMFAIC